jgi:DNA-binding transcriptional ArsR family regulator
MDGELQPLLGGRAGLERSAIVADPRQRRILSILESRARPTTVDELGRRLAAVEHGDEAAVDDADRRSIRLDLRHRCLPSLEAVGWIDRRPDGIRLDDPLSAVDLSLPPLRTPDDPAWPVVSALLARPSRRAILSVVADHDGHLTLTDLAAELRLRDDVQPDDDRRLPIALHHVDLPKLAAIEVIEYDPDTRTVTPTPSLAACLDRLGIE